MTEAFIPESPCNPTRVIKSDEQMPPRGGLTMTAEQLRQHITATPFTPFHIRTGDGHRIPVLNRDFILITPTQLHAFIFQPDNSYQVLDINLLVGVEFGPPGVTPPVPNLNA